MFSISIADSGEYIIFLSTRQKFAKKQKKGLNRVV
jgi:hypothetical protein